MTENPLQFRIDRWMYKVKEIRRPKHEIYPDAYHWFNTRDEAIAFLKVRHQQKMEKLGKELKNEDVRFKAFCRKEKIS